MWRYTCIRAQIGTTVGSAPSVVAHALPIHALALDTLWITRDNLRCIFGTSKQTKEQEQKEEAKTRQRERDKRQRIDI